MTNNKSWIEKLKDDIAEIKAETASIKTQTDKIAAKMLFTMDFWSLPQEEVQVPAIPATKTLPSVVITDLPSGATVARAIALFACRVVENVNAASNKLENSTVPLTSQVIQVTGTPGSYVDAIKFVDDQFGIAAETREGGPMLVGSIDIVAQVDRNDTYDFRWLLAHAERDFLQFNDVQVGLRIWYSL